jgi:hypothetical protein
MECAPRIDGHLRNPAGFAKYHLLCADQKAMLVMWSLSLHNLGATAMKNFAPQLTRKQFNEILDAYNIPASDRPALAGLVYYGKMKDGLFDKIDGRWRRSRKNGEYAKCMEALLAALSAPFYAEHRFPPPDWQPTKRQLARIGG